MPAALFVGGITRLQSTSTTTACSSGVTVARTNSGPIVNSGLGRDARKICPSATAGAAANNSTASQARLMAPRASGRVGLGQARTVHLRLDVAHAIAVELDLELVVLDVPAL